MSLLPFDLLLSMMSAMAMALAAVSRRGIMSGMNGSGASYLPTYIFNRWGDRRLMWIYQFPVRRGLEMMVFFQQQRSLLASWKMDAPHCPRWINYKHGIGRRGGVIYNYWTNTINKTQYLISFIN